MDIVTGPLMAATGVSVGGSAASGVSAALPSGSATARFAEIMAADMPDPTKPSGAAPVGGFGPVPPVGSGEAFSAPAVRNSLGDRILNGLSSASSDFQQSLNKVTAVLDAGEQMSTADLMKLQLNLVQVSIQYDLIGKAISRTTQNIDQMVKIQ